MLLYINHSNELGHVEVVSVGLTTRSLHIRNGKISRTRERGTIEQKLRISHRLGNRAKDKLRVALAANRTRGPSMATMDFTTKPLVPLKKTQSIGAHVFAIRTNFLNRNATFHEEKYVDSICVLLSSHICIKHRGIHLLLEPLSRNSPFLPNPSAASTFNQVVDTWAFRRAGCRHLDALGASRGTVFLTIGQARVGSGQMVASVGLALLYKVS
jgi:hypothetical protein